MHTAQQDHAPHSDGALQPETQSVPTPLSLLLSTARLSRAWRCFVGAFALLVIFVAVGCGGGGGSSIGGGGNNGGSASISIQVRDRNTGALVPAAIVSTRTPAAGETPQATATPLPVTVRLVGKSFDKSTSFNDPQAGAQFGSVPAGIYQVFVNSERSSPDIIVASSATSGGVTQTFQVIQGVNGGSQFLSKVTVQGRTLLSVPPIITPGSGSPTATPTPSTSCPSSQIATGAYLIRVINYNTKRVVAVYSKPNLAETYTITNIPLTVVNGSPVATTFYLQIFTDPSDTSTQTSFAGSSALFTVGRTTSPSGATTLTIPDICATQGSLIRTPTATSTPGALTPTATSGGIDFPTPIGGG